MLIVWALIPIDLQRRLCSLQTEEILIRNRVESESGMGEKYDRGGIPEALMWRWDHSSCFI